MPGSKEGAWKLPSDSSQHHVGRLRAFFTTVFGVFWVLDDHQCLDPAWTLDGVFFLNRVVKCAKHLQLVGFEIGFSLMVRHNLGNALAALGHGTAVWALKWTPTADNEGYSFDPSVIF